MALAIRSARGGIAYRAGALSHTPRGYDGVGHLTQLEKANEPGLIYWRADAVNAEGQIERELRDVDAATDAGIPVTRQYEPRASQSSAPAPATAFRT